MPRQLPSDPDSLQDQDGDAAVDYRTLLDDDQEPGAEIAVDDEHLSPLARWVGSDEGILWIKRTTLGLALAVFIGVTGYLLGARTTEPPRNAADAGFLRDMTDHHDQAVTMAQLELAHGSDDIVKKFAMEVIMFQRQEIGRMQGFKDDLGVKDEEYSDDRIAMDWMGMPTPLKNMPGMATDDQLKQLENARRIEADKLFLTLMQAHHLGGAHMGDYEAQHGANPAVSGMAGRMAKNQRVEVNEYRAVLKRLNGER